MSWIPDEMYWLGDHITLEGVDIETNNTIMIDQGDLTEANCHIRYQQFLGNEDVCHLLYMPLSTRICLSTDLVSMLFRALRFKGTEIPSTQDRKPLKRRGRR